MGFFRKLFGLEDDRTFGAPRSGKWPTVRKHFLEGKTCAACGSSDSIEAHHVVPFHIAPDKELDEHNLIALCDSHGCHFAFGHLYSWKAYNQSVRADAESWLIKVRKRKEA